MSADSSADGHVESQLRQRLPTQPDLAQQAPAIDAAKQAVIDLNSAEDQAGKKEEDKRTYGRTPAGKGMLDRLVPLLSCAREHVIDLQQDVSS